ncbi:SagB/ThcOx family dehydrogenase [Frankia sp. B2]|uniref:SagB/ThcOx family dehydrogenase n=1 Tax=Frankia sp. B2 TaxID=2541730 RepID=UPI00106D9EEA|nr:SagB family peptide dehydrogenase [Frankia sp. B2]TFE32575.1 SagB/ThcOx family dehydrogenase [Frankia sp. B2]
MAEDVTALERIRRVQQVLNGPPTRQVMLDGLRAATCRIPLPAPRADLPVEFGQVLAARRSWYRFDAEAPTAENVSSLLRWAVGPQRDVRLPDGSQHRMWMAPSAGGLHSLSIYLVIARGAQLPGGVFRYDAEDHCLQTLRSGEPTAALRSVLVQPEFAERAPMAVVVVARLDTTLVKYPARHYRTLHLDAGIAVQNIYLVAAALGLAGCAVTAFDDQALAELLRLPDTMFPTVVFPVGRQPVRPPTRHAS